VQQCQSRCMLALGYCGSSRLIQSIRSAILLDTVTCAVIEQVRFTLQPLQSSCNPPL
jgi:hypothetical protein